MHASRRRLLTALALLPLAGCGFHLRGSVELPFKTIFLDLNMNSRIGARIARNIRNGTPAQIVDKVEDAEAVFKLARVSRGSHVLSYNDKGDAREFELAMSLAFKITSPTGVEYLPLQVVHAHRSLTWDDSQTTGRDKEEEVLYTDMEDDLVAQVFRRLRLVKKPEQP